MSYVGKDLKAVPPSYAALNDEVESRDGRDAVYSPAKIARPARRRCNALGSTATERGDG